MVGVNRQNIDEIGCFGLLHFDKKSLLFILAEK